MARASTSVPDGDRDAGLSRKPRKKPRLTVRKKKARLQFVLAHKSVMAQGFFSIRTYVRRMSGEEFKEYCT